MITKRMLLAGGIAMPSLSFSLPAFGASVSGLVVREDRLYLPVVVNGQAVTALLDSAAETSFMDLSFARKIGVVGDATVGAHGSGGDTDVQLAKGVVVEALGLKLGPLTVAVLDLSDVGTRLLHGPLPLILGRELFDAARLFIDIKQQDIRVVSKAHEPEGVRLDLKTERGIETFPAAVEGHSPVGAAFDLGNANGVLVGAQYAAQIGLLTDGRPVVEKKGGGIGGEKLRKTVTLRSLEIAGKRFENVPAAIDDSSSATKLNIGVPQLKNFAIVTDFAAHRLWLKPYQ